MTLSHYFHYKQALKLSEGNGVCSAITHVALHQLRSCKDGIGPAMLYNNTNNYYYQPHSSQKQQVITVIVVDIAYSVMSFEQQ